MSTTLTAARHPAASLPRTRVADLGGHVGQTVRLSGWLHHVRELKSVAFLLLRDATGIAQIVVEAPEQRSILRGCSHETVLEIHGTVVVSSQAPAGVEVHDPRITVISPAEELPIDISRPEVQAQRATQLDHAAIALRHPTRATTQRVAAAALDGFRDTLRDHGFVEVTTPKLLESAPEGGADVFPVDYFGRTAYLAQSPQLYKQMLVGAFERVFETGPAFRAEPHDTHRHVSQFLSLDAELGFIEDHTTVMAMVTEIIRGMMSTITERLGTAGVTEHVPSVPEEIPAIHFREALQRIHDATGEDVLDEPDLAPAHERWLSDWARATYGSDWLFVTGYPMTKRPFYTHPDPVDPAWSNSFDLLFRGLEVVTGGQRLHRYEDYVAALEARGIEQDPFAGYLEAFRYGMPPHGGFAMGLERMVGQLLGIHNLRDVVLFPRDLQRLAP